MMTNVPTEVSFVFSDPSHLSPPLVLDSDASDADGFLLRLSPSLSALQHALALHLPSFFPSLSPSSSSYHCALTSPFSLSHSGGILHLSTSTFHAHLTPLLSPPLPLRHLLTPFICLPPPHPTTTTSSVSPFHSFSPPSRTLAFAVSCKLTQPYTHSC